MSMIKHEIMRFAEPRSRVVTRPQLREELGLSDRMIKSHIAERFLAPLHRHVFFVGAGEPTIDARALAACLAYTNVSIGFSSGASLYGLRRARRDQFDLIVPPSLRPHVPHARIHYSADLDAADFVEHISGLRVTHPARTLFDMASQLDQFGLRSMLEDCLNKEILTMEQCDEAMRRLGRRGRTGSRLFGAVVGSRSPHDPPAQSEDELRLFDALVDAGLPPPARQYPVQLAAGRVFLDLFMEDSRLDIEVDHSHWHSGIIEVLRDKSRDLELRCRGIEPVRITEVHVREQLLLTVDRIQRIHELRLGHQARGA
jgi:very-short-patch-repair endonuclease